MPFRKIKFCTTMFAFIVLAAALFPALSGCLSTRNAQYNFQIIDFDWERAYGDLSMICEFGPRLSGGEGEKKATAYFVRQFEDAGLSDVHVEYFETTCYEVEHASMALVKYDLLGAVELNRTQFAHGSDFILQGYSGSTNGIQSFEIIYAGDGTNASYDATGDVSGKAVIIQKNSSVSFSVAYLNAALRGAAANLFHNTAIHPELGCPPISFSASGKNQNGETVPYPDAYPDKLIPSMMISNATGQAILKAINETLVPPIPPVPPAPPAPQINAFNYKLELDVKVKIEKRQIPVVIADVKGRGDKVVMVGAHSDTVYVSPGAVDNTGGACTVIEIARQLAGTRPKHTIRLALWSGEEEGLLGSTYYVKAHQSEIENRLIAYLNLDMNHINFDRGNTGSINSNDNATLRVLENLTKAAQERHPSLAKFNISFSWWNCIGGSDQTAFAKLNKTAACFWGSGALEYHTIWDTKEHVTPEGLAPGGIIFGSYALWLANT